LGPTDRWNTSYFPSRKKNNAPQLSRECKVAFNNTVIAEVCVIQRLCACLACSRVWSVQASAIDQSSITATVGADRNSGFVEDALLLCD
jgi:hypothetical protein